MAAATLPKLRALTQSVHHFWQGQPALWRNLLPAEAARRFPKPIIAMVVGRHAPAQKQMGHAGALIGYWRESAQSKLEALDAAGCRIAMGLEDAVTMAGALKL